MMQLLKGEIEKKKLNKRKKNDIIIVYSILWMWPHSLVFR